MQISNQNMYNSISNNKSNSSQNRNQNNISFTARPGVPIIIAGNWKMNTVPSEVKNFFAPFKAALSPIYKAWSSISKTYPKPEIVICTPSIALDRASKFLNKIIKLGAQNFHPAEKGPYTGEISAKMIQDVKGSHVIIGHSERRTLLKESNKFVNEKAIAAHKQGLTPIICCGESEIQRVKGLTDKLITKQIKSAIKGLTNEQVEKSVFAYEPIWAIGTGKTCDAAEADRVCGLIRNVLAEKIGPEEAYKVRVLYGGSANAKNAGELIQKTNIDGFLVGGASLKADDFAAIVKNSFSALKDIVTGAIA
jgi:triosephosphate isomerase